MYIVCAGARIIKKISSCRDVFAVTSVDDELFMLLALSGRVDFSRLSWLLGRRDPPDDNQVAVYSISDYKLLRHLNMPGLKLYSNSDMTSCHRYKCLYMSDCNRKRIHRYDLASGATNKWSVPGTPHGLSVTPSCNLLVICYEPNKLVELSADSGRCVREIALPSDIVCPWHSVQLTTGESIVCHGVTGLNQVCVVGDDGKVTRSYGGQRGSKDGPLCCPIHLAVDKDSQFIFLADQGNNRVVLLSPTLEFVHEVIKGVSWPSRLYLQQATRRLFVGHQNDVTVIQL